VGKRMTSDDSGCTYMPCAEERRTCQRGVSSRSRGHRAARYPARFTARHAPLSQRARVISCRKCTSFQLCALSAVRERRCSASFIRTSSRDGQEHLRRGATAARRALTRLPIRLDGPSIASVPSLHSPAAHHRSLRAAPRIRTSRRRISRLCSSAPRGRTAGPSGRQRGSGTERSAALISHKPRFPPSGPLHPTLILASQRPHNEHALQA
jgi:hypothetical protein